MEVMAANTRLRARFSAWTLLVAIGFLSSQIVTSVDAQLALNYYSKSCPRAEKTVASIVKSVIRKDRSLAASILRLHFHDCFVIGCEGSILIDSTAGNLAEKDGGPNVGSMRGFDVIDRIKTAVEKRCPGVVSCADILALAARDAISRIGGPWWSVDMGRRDGRLSSARLAAQLLPTAGQSWQSLVNLFAAVGLDANDLVVLSGAHTIGTTRCATIEPRLYNFPGTLDGIDPALNKGYARQLKKACPSGSQNRVTLDPTFGGQSFDTNYYANLYNNAGLFPSDESLLSTDSSRRTTLGEVSDQGKFFADFGWAMRKMGAIGVLTDATPYKGEIRQSCSRVNPLSSRKKRTSKKAGRKTSKRRRG